MTLPQRTLAEKLSLPPMILAIEKATAVLILKQRQKLARLTKIKDFTAIPHYLREGKLEKILKGD
jgi:ribosome-binding protein aMBF1 (putative translation factor)